MADCIASKRRCADVADGADRLGDLPDSLLQVIISLLGFRQAVQTGVLSRRWKNLWRGMPVVDIDEREFAGDGQTWDRFEDFVDHALTSIPPGTQLDAFRLHVVSCDTATSSRWIRRGLRHLPAAVSIHGTNAGHSLVCWNPHVSSPPRNPFRFRYAAADGLWQQRGMSACAAGFTRRLTTLRLVGAGISRGFFEELGRNCPALEELHAERCLMHMLSLASPVLRRLAVISPVSARMVTVVPGLEAPRLTSLRLDIMYGGEITYGLETGVGPAPQYHLPALTEASLRLTDTSANVHLPDHQAWDWENRKLIAMFLDSMCGFLARLTNIVSLHLHGFIAMALLQKESQEFPVLNNLRNLHLEECDVGLSYQVLTSILRNTPNLEKLALHWCTFEAPPIMNRRKEMASSKLHGSTTPAVFWCKKLKSMDIKCRKEDETHMARVLSEISKGMAPEQWERVKTSDTIVSVE
nr:MEIOTIC F-BOX protein MOF-like [Aegilops tauschii subsp. strangulata]